MADQSNVYKCEICGQIVEVLHSGGGTLVCCKQPMKFMAEGSIDAALEKHVPVIEQVGDGFLVKVGDVAHPMGDDHYIEWIELVVDGILHRCLLKPGDKPEVVFKAQGSDVMARAYCNLHGAWKSI